MPAALRYFLDSFGYLWGGPVRRRSGKVELKRFEGAHPHSCAPIWRWQGDLEGGNKLPQLEEISEKRAHEIVSLHITDARTRKQQPPPPTSL